MIINEILNKVYLGNTVLQYFTCICIILVGLIIINIFEKIVIKKQQFITAVVDKLTGRAIDIKIQKYFSPFLYVILFYASIKSILTLSDKIDRVVYIIFLIALTYYGIRLISTIVKNSIISYMAKTNKDYQEVEQRVRGISTFNNIIIWTLGIIFLISNTGFNITGIITGLGIGGIALALASQNIFMDLFNYFVIFFDQPFQIGDFIVLDDKLGTVEKIGIKTTRIRSLRGEEIIVSNSDLTSKRIHNYKKMEKRRVLFTFGVVYQTVYEKLAEIPAVVKNIIDNTESAEFDRCHFKEYGDSSLNFEVVYYVLSPDYNIYMDTQQKINLDIFKEFKKGGIEFAYPTRTIYIEK